MYELNGPSQETDTGGVNDIIPGEGSWLLLDAGLPALYAGVLRNGEWLALERRWGSAGEELFAAVREALAASGVGLDGLAGFLYCEGPGSILGMRIAAMAVRVWRRRTTGRLPCLAYGNLELLAVALLENGETPPFAVFSDARRGHWNCLEVSGTGRFSALRRVSDEELAGIRPPLWRAPEASPVRPAPAPADTPPYDLEPGAPWFTRYPLLREVEEPEPRVLRPPEYRKWRNGAAG